jgi:hypothetical protein
VATRDDRAVGIGPFTVGTHATRLLLVRRRIVALAEVNVTATYHRTAAQRLVLAAVITE